MASTNPHLVALFRQWADVLEILGADKFKVIAYQKTSRILEDVTVDLATVPREQLAKIPGIGKGSATRIAEYLDTGRIAEFENAVAQVPPGVLQMLDVPGLGAKTAAKFWQQCNVTTIAQLETALQDGSLNCIKGFGPKKAEQLLKNLRFVGTAGQRTRIGKALPIAEALVAHLATVTGAEQVTYAGSLRRGQETIGDLDLLVAADAKHAKAISEAFVSFAGVTEVILQGETKTSIRLDGDLQADLRIVPPSSYGAALMYFTGSKEHNVRLRERARKQKLTLNEYGLYPESRAGEKTADRGEPVASRTEEDIYGTLGLAWIPPELREDRGEVALAEAGDLPTLIERGDIQAELHTHTTASDGVWTIREIAAFAIERGYHTLAITDHSRGQAQANGLTIDRLERHIVAVREVAAELKGKLRLLAGSEVDILSDGKLDYPDELLAELDVVVASPHAALSQDPAKATARLLKAIANPYVTILGHPTGRLVGRREGLSPDIAALCKAAAERGIALEINANSYRLDLRDSHARAALEAGCKLAINTDAHGPGDMDQLRYGILTARRAGATARDVVNCLSADALATWIAATRQ